MRCVNKRNNYYACTQRQRRNHNKNIMERVTGLKKYVKSIGLDLVGLHLNKIVPNHINKVDIVIDDEPMPIRDQIIFESLKVKDLANVSYNGYDIFKNGLTFMPKKYRLPCRNSIKSMKTRLNNFFEINTENDFEYWCEPTSKIEFACRDYLRHNAPPENNLFIIKLGCDGTIITKSNVHLLNFTFTLINNEKKCKTSHGNNILGMYSTL